MLGGTWRGGAADSSSNTPTWVAEGAADGVAALEQELDDPRRDEAAGARHAYHLLRHAGFFDSLAASSTLYLCAMIHART